MIKFIHFLVVLLAVMTVSKPAHAYVDPGSGLFALQIIGVALAGAAFHFRNFLQRISMMFFRKKETEKPEKESDSSQE